MEKDEDKKKKEDKDELSERTLEKVYAGVAPRRPPPNKP